MAASGSVVLVSTMHWCAVNSRCFEQKLLLHLHTMVCSTKLNFFLQWAHFGFFGMVLYIFFYQEKKTPTSNLEKKNRISLMHWLKYRHPNHFRPFFESFEDDGWEYCSNNLALNAPSSCSSLPPSKIRRLTSIISSTFLNSLIPAFERVK